MKTNHSQVPAFMVFSWMIFLSFFNNKKPSKPATNPKPTPAIIIKPAVSDSVYQHLTLVGQEVDLDLTAINNK